MLNGWRFRFGFKSFLLISVRFRKIAVGNITTLDVNRDQRNILLLQIAIILWKGRIMLECVKSPDCKCKTKPPCCLKGLWWSVLEENSWREWLNPKFLSTPSSWLSWNVPMATKHHWLGTEEEPHSNRSRMHPSSNSA